LATLFKKILEVRCFFYFPGDNQNFQNIYLDYSLSTTFTNQCSLFHQELVSGLTFSGTNLLAAAKGSSIRIWNSDNWELLKDIEGLKGIFCLTFNENDLLASGSLTGEVVIWNTDNFEEIKVINAHPGIPVENIAFKKNLLASLSSKGVHIYDTDSWDLVRLIEYDFFSCIAINEKNLALGLKMGNTCIYETNTFDLVQMLDTHTAAVNCVEFNRNNILASGCKEGSIFIWNSDSWQFIMKLDGHTDCISSISFNERNQFVSASWDNTVRFWSTENWNLLQVLKNEKEMDDDEVIFCIFNIKNFMARTLTRSNKIEIWVTENGIAK